MNKKKIILTFDYEIFFGKNSGTIENCILKPTNLLLDKMKQYNIKGIFFIDILYYLSLLKYPELSKQAAAMKSQIQRMILEGHMAELHLHPHWLDAVYENNAWNFTSYKKYRFDNLNKEEQELVFKKGISTLLDIIQEINPNYELSSYRAGGWCIQPFTDIKPFFEKYGIKYDSSASYAIKCDTGIHKFDFTKIPNKEYYKFDSNINMEDTTGNFMEIPISSFKKNFFEKIYCKIINSIRPCYGDGIGMSLSEKNNIIKKLLNKISTSTIMYTIEGNNYNKWFFNKIKNDKREILVFISHPKSLTENSFKMIDKMIEHDYEFILFDEIKEI